MNIFETDFWGITNGMFITFAGLIAVAGDFYDIKIAKDDSVRDLLMMTSRYLF